MWRADPGFHPELRTTAALLPGRLVGPHSFRLSRALWNLNSRLHVDREVDVVPVSPTAAVRLRRPSGSHPRGPALLWIHGGGYVVGTAQREDRLCHHFAETLSVPVAAVAYRLAPEHPYPAALQDCYAALSWLTDQPWADPNRIAIGGASAGGGLAAALALLARDRGELTPRFQLLTYPMLDDRSSFKPELDDKRHRVWNQRANRFGWSAYLGTIDPGVAVPARRTDLSGLPPAWIGVGTLDLFCTEDLDYAERLRQAGVPCETQVVAGAFHGFDRAVPKAAVSRAFFAHQCEALRAALA